MAYERKVQKHLSELYEGYIPSPWLEFSCGGESEKRFCCPDGILVDIKRGLIVIVEVKLSHTADAWWQIRHLYQPLLEVLFGPNWRFAACEVTKFIDPATVFPEPFVRLRNIDDALPGKFGVHVWR